MSQAEGITAEDLLDELARHDVLETFCQLPAIEQEKFSRLIGEARSDESHWRRVQALVMALKTGPMRHRGAHRPTIAIEKHN